MILSQIMATARSLIMGQNPDQEWVLGNLLVLHVGGSRLYGTHNDDSDWDIRGITVPPKDYWVGARKFEQWTCKLPESKLDFTIWDVRKWLSLTAHVNPNVVETLYVVPDSPAVIYWSPDWNWIRDRTMPLINQRAHAAFHGYAISQIKKMVSKQDNKTGRREIVESHGFDTKFVAHGFRLASQGAELIRTGKMTFPRPDAKHLRAIRDGKVYQPNELARCAAEWARVAQELDEAVLDTVLPAKPDFDRHNQLLVDIYDGLVA